MTTVTLLIPLISVAAFAASLLPASAATLTTFDVPGSISTSPVSINQGGTITGPYAAGPGTCDVHGFIRASNGTISTFDPQGTSGFLIATYPAAINDGGDIAGTYYEAPNCSHPVAHGFLLTAAGETISFDLASCTCLLISGLNNGRAIIGYYVDTSDGSIHSILRSPNGRLKSFAATGATYTRAMSINDNGFITGNAEDSQHHVRGFLRSPHGKIVQFDAPDATATYPHSINKAKAITGYAYTSTGERGFVRAADGTITMFDIAGGNATEPHSIDSRGWTTGLYLDVANEPHKWRGFLRKNNGQTITFEASGSNRTDGLAINLAGTITGDYLDSSSVPHGFVRTP